MYKVLIIQRILPSYRKKFFYSLHNKLINNGISLKLVYGQEYFGTVPKSININESWTFKLKNKYIKLFHFEAVWQPIPIKVLENVDLVIIEQGNRFLINYYFLIIRLFKPNKVAFWGHGKNLQSHNRISLREIVKKFLINKVDWWFAYTELSSNFIKTSNFPKTRITNVQNSIDSSGFQNALHRVENNKISSIKKELGIGGGHILLYCGGMYQEKKLDFLVQSCNKLKMLVPELHVIFIGDGPDHFIIENAAKATNWLHYIGPKFDSDRAPYFLMSKAMLMPGLVGLSIVDCFIAGIPLFTTDIPIHSPEINYLVNGENGVMTNHNVDDYVEQLYQYLLSEELQEKLKKGCIESAKKYTLDNMVNNFSEGITKCLES